MKKYLFLSVLVVFSLVFINTNVNAASEFFTDSFGSTSSNNVPDWTDDGGDDSEDTRVTSSEDRAGSSTTQHARVGDEGHITRTISTVGYENIVLKYYWRGDNDGDGSSDNLKVYWKKTSDVSFILLNTHQLDGNGSWSSQVSVSLDSSADNTSIDIRFLGDSNHDDNEEGRIDDVSLEGDVLTPPDTEDPVIEAHSDVTVEATSSSGAVVAYTAPNATDNVDATAPAICLPASGSLFALGSTLITCNKTDSSGNEATPTTFDVIVQDTTAPVITLTGSSPVDIQVFSVYAELGAIATDIVDGILSAVVGGDTVDTSILGTYLVTYNKTDANSNIAVEVTRTVNVVDEEAPSTTDDVPSLWQNMDTTITLSCTDNVECAKVYYTTDGTEPTTSSSFVDSGSSWQFTVTTEGMHTIKYFGVDDSDNAESIQTADNTLKIDKTAPTAEVTSPTASAYLKGTVELTATATDTDGSGVAKVGFWHATENTEIGEDMDAPYSMNWDTTNTTDGAHDIWVVAYDEAGNITTSALVPVTIDNTAPVITLVGTMEFIMYLNESYIEQGATAMDDVDGDITTNIIITDNFVNPLDLGTYTVTYTVTDTAGNTSVKTRMMHVLFPPGAGGGGGNSGGAVLGASTQNTEEENTTTSTNEETTPKAEETPRGEVLGENTCDIEYLTDYLSQNKKNKVDQVKLLQSFLNLELSLDPALLVDGVFGKTTKKAVIAFQEKYKDDILTPWIPFGLKDGKGTGNVYKLTKWKINMMKCPALNTPVPQLP